MNRPWTRNPAAPFSLPPSRQPPPPTRHAPTPDSPTRICANWPAVASQGARPPAGPPGPALTGPAISSVGVPFEPYGFGNEVWRWRPWEEAVGDEPAGACCPSAGCCCTAGPAGDRPSVIPGTEIKYTEPVGSVPP